MEIISPSAFRVNMGSRELRDRSRVKRRVMYPIMMMSVSLSSDYIPDSNCIMLDHSLYDSHNESSTPCKSPLTYSSAYPVGRSKHLREINDLWNEVYSESSSGKQRASCKLHDNSISLSRSFSSSASSSPPTTGDFSPLKSIMKCNKSPSRGTSTARCSSHVNFSLDSIQLHTFEDDAASRESRRGTWKSDGDRFRQRVDFTEFVLKGILSQSHRDKIWTRLHSPRDNSL